MFHAKKVGRRWNERKGGVRGRRKKKGVLLCTVKLESGFSEAAHRDEEIERKQHGCIQGYQEKTGMNKGTIDADVLSEPPGQSLSLLSLKLSRNGPRVGIWNTPRSAALSVHLYACPSELSPTVASSWMGPLAKFVALGWQPYLAIAFFPLMVKETTFVEPNVLHLALLLCSVAICAKAQKNSLVWHLLGRHGSVYLSPARVLISTVCLKSDTYIDGMSMACLEME